MKHNLILLFSLSIRVTRCELRNIWAHGFVEWKYNDICRRLLSSTKPYCSLR